MKKILFWGFATLALGISLSLGACGNNNNTALVPVGGTPTGWQVMSDGLGSDTPSFTDFTPKGKSSLYSASGNGMYVFSFPTGTYIYGVFTSLTGTDGGTYTSPAWYGNTIYKVYSNSVYAYDIAGDSWSTRVTGTLDFAHDDAQSTADDSGFIYSLATGSTALLKFNTADSTFEYIPAPSNIWSGDEPRAAWDSKTKRVYLADYEGTVGFYAFNPKDNSFTALTPVPDADGFRDAFCSDRHGHIYTSNTHNTVYKYTAATDTWTTIQDFPYTISDSPSCTVSADGWLFFSNDSGNFFRIKVF